MSVVQLHAHKATDDVPATLERVASQIRAGELDWPVTTAILVLGHTDSERPSGNGDYEQRAFWTTYGAGPRVDAFTCRGLLASVLNDWNDNG